jgi:hypothetical protein
MVLNEMNTIQWSCERHTNPYYQAYLYKGTQAMPL